MDWKEHIPVVEEDMFVVVVEEDIPVVVDNHLEEDSPVEVDILEEDNLEEDNLEEDIQQTVVVVELEFVIPLSCLNLNLI